MNKELNAPDVTEIMKHNDLVQFSETDSLLTTSSMFIREKGKNRELNAADICGKNITDDLHFERDNAVSSDNIKPLFRLYDKSKLIIREIMATLRGCDEYIAECIGSNITMVTVESEKQVSGASGIKEAAKIKNEQEDLMIKEAEEKSTCVSLFILTAIGIAAAWFIPFIAYICAGISLYASVKNTEGRIKLLLVVSNIIVLAAACVCHAIQSLSL